MKKKARIVDKRTGKALYEVDVEFPDPKGVSKTMQAAGILEAERELIARTFEVQWVEDKIVRGRL